MSRVEHLSEDVTLYLGDCRDVLPTLGKVDAIITDPPYGARTHARHDASTERRRDGAAARQLGYSALSPQDAADMAVLFDQHCSGWCVWFTDSDLAGPVRSAMDAVGRTTFAPLPYHHPGRSVRLAGDGPSSWTDWIVVSRTKAQKSWGTLPGGYVAGPGWNDKERMGGKPLPLMNLVVKDYSAPGDVVADPFMGSGTTGVAAVALGRRFVGCEIDAKAFDLACRRVADELRRPRFALARVAKPIQEAMQL